MERHRRERKGRTRGDWVVQFSQKMVPYGQTKLMFKQKQKNQKKVILKIIIAF